VRLVVSLLPVLAGAALSFPVSEALAAGQGAGQRRILEQPLDARTRRLYEQIILEGSMNVSNTVAKGVTRSTMSPGDVRRLSQRNFRRTVRWMLSHAHQLDLSRRTALRINRMLREGIVEDRFFHESGFGMFHWRLPAWQKILSPQNLERGVRAPVWLAEKLHSEAQSYSEDFYEGNGRTSRLMADLALIQSGRAPALYPSQAIYFRRRSPDQRDQLRGRSGGSPHIELERNRKSVERAFRQHVAAGRRRYEELRAAGAAARGARARPTAARARRPARGP
jgi:hypothetical protein